MTSPATGAATSSAQRCPCGTGLLLAECCGPVLAGAPAPTAEALMRSRYTAFAVGDPAHLHRSWAAATRPPRVELDPQQRWTGLEVLASRGGRFLDAEGEVDFRASWTEGGRRRVHRERSRFVREAGRWVYVGPAPVS